MTQTYYLAPAFRPRYLNPGKAAAPRTTTHQQLPLPPTMHLRNQPTVPCVPQPTRPRRPIGDPPPSDALKALAKLDSASHLSRTVAGPGGSAVGLSGELGLGRGVNTSRDGGGRGQSGHPGQTGPTRASDPPLSALARQPGSQVRHSVVRRAGFGPTGSRLRPSRLCREARA